MTTFLAIGLAWLSLSVVFTIGWSRFNRRIETLEVIAEAERILEEAARR